MSQPTTGSAFRYRVAGVTLNGEPWPFTAATLWLRAPDHVTLTSHIGTVAGGVGYADVVHEQSGNWLFSWHLEDNDVSIYTKAQVQNVEPGKLSARPRLGTIACT